jgi:hypothetical protein
MQQTKPLSLGTNKFTARIAGFFYLLFILASILADRFARLGFSEPEEIAAGMAANSGLFRAGFVMGLLSALFFLLAAWALYVLLKTVQPDLALLFLLLNLTGVAIQCFSTLAAWAGMLLQSGAPYLQAFTPEQVQALAFFSASLYKHSFTSAQLFYGAWLLPLGYLVYKSGFLPRVLGVLLLLDFFGVLIWFSQFFLLPDFKAISYPGVMVSALAEFSLTFWLLIIGIKAQKPALAQAGSASANQAPASSQG